MGLLQAEAAMMAYFSVSEDSHRGETTGDILTQRALLIPQSALRRPTRPQVALPRALRNVGERPSTPISGAAFQCSEHCIVDKINFETHRTTRQTGFIRMSKDTELLTEIRDLLQIIAEPALAKRDAKLRESLRRIAGSSSKKANAILLMDGSRSQAAIAKEASMDKSDLSKLVKALGSDRLIHANSKEPLLTMKIPSNFFEDNSTDE